MQLALFLCFLLEVTKMRKENPSKYKKKHPGKSKITSQNPYATQTILVFVYFLNTRSIFPESQCIVPFGSDLKDLCFKKNLFLGESLPCVSVGMCIY